MSSIKLVEFDRMSQTLESVSLSLQQYRSMGWRIVGQSENAKRDTVLYTLEMYNPPVKHAVSINRVSSFGNNDLQDFPCDAVPYYMMPPQVEVVN